MCLDFAVTPVILVRQKQQSEIWSVDSIQTTGMAKEIQREPFAHAARSLARHTTKTGSPPHVLITHFAAEIMLMAFLNQGCEYRLRKLNVTSQQI